MGWFVRFQRGLWLPLAATALLVVLAAAAHRLLRGSWLSATAAAGALVVLLIIIAAATSGAWAVAVLLPFGLLLMIATTVSSLLIDDSPLSRALRRASAVLLAFGTLARGSRRSPICSSAELAASGLSPSKPPLGVGRACRSPRPPFDELRALS